MESNLSSAQFKRIAAFAKKLRIENKISENNGKPPLISGDVLETADFTFSEFTSKEKEGDSGSLYLAKKKTDKNVRYIVKHAYTDCACNEFMYYCVSEALGLRVPKVKLFNISKGEKRNYFKTETVAGIEYLNIIQEPRGFKDINKDKVSNWADYFGFNALYYILCEIDSFEIVIDENNILYKIDNAASFNLSFYWLDNIGFDFEHGGINIKETVYNQLMMTAEHSSYNSYSEKYNSVKEQYGEEAARYFLTPFERFAQINLEIFDDCINTLCYFYADMLGDFYKKFLKLRKEECVKFLNTIKKTCK